MIEHRDHIKLLSPQGALSVSLEVSGTPLVQSEESDRILLPTIITSVIKRENKEDSSQLALFDSGDYMLYGDGNEVLYGTKNSSISNADLTSIGWAVDGKPISLVWSDGYSIAQSGENKGQLTITKNLKSGEYHSIVFTAKYVRNGQSYIISSNEILIGCTAQSSSSYYASCSASQIGYTERMDRLLLHEYLQANNKEESGDVSQYVDGKSYLCKATVLLCKGSEPIIALPSEIKMELRVNGEVQEVGTFAASWLLKASYPDIWIDLRLVDTLQIKIVFLQESIEIASTYLTAKRKFSNKTKSNPSGGYDVPKYTQGYNDLASLYDDYGKVEYPELHYDITWKSEQGNEIGYGELVKAYAANLGLSSDKVVEVQVDGKERGAFAPAVDEEGIYLTDEDNYTLII